jgi:predicted RecA/RadA family phage recombinase
MAMQAVFVQEGRVIDYTPTAAVSAGDVVIQGDLVGVAKEPIAANATGSLAVSGIFDFQKSYLTIYAAGAKVYWDAANKLAVATDASGVNKYLGKVANGLTVPNTTVRVLLIP